MKNSKNLLDKIKKKNIRQKSKLEFSLKNMLFWGLFVLSIIMGAVVISLIVHAIQNVEFELIVRAKHKRLGLIAGFIPFLWITLSVIFFVSSIYGIHHTSKGYKIPEFKLYFFTFLISVIIAILVLIPGGTRHIERMIDSNIPFYQSVEDKRMNRWLNPEQGFLAGKVVEINVDFLKIKDIKGREWLIDILNVDNAKLKVKIGDKIKIIGKIKSENIFIAEEILNWEDMLRSRRK